MVNINDVYNAIQGVNANLQTVQAELIQGNNAINTGFANVSQNMQTIQTELTQVDNDMNTGFDNVSQNMQTLIALNRELVNLNQTIVKLQTYADQALFHISEQNDTIICNLEKISKLTCDMLNESHIQTDLQKSTKENTNTLLELYRLSHPEAACEFERLNKLHKEILKCCPKEKPGPFCTYGPCKGPGSKLSVPPMTDTVPQ